MSRSALVFVLSAFIFVHGAHAAILPGASPNDAPRVKRSFERIVNLAAQLTAGWPLAQHSNNAGESGLLAYSLPSDPTLVNLDITKAAVLKYYKSGAYDQDLDNVFASASSYIRSIKVTNATTVVFDVDDTILSSFDEFLSWQFGFLPKEWDAWVESKQGKLIPQTFAFYNLLLQLNINVVFLTGRPQSNYQATVENLHAEGVHTWREIITRGAEDVGKTAAVYKSAKRTELANRGYDIVACVGDQWSDVSGPFTGLRVKVPNYIYSLA